MTSSGKWRSPVGLCVADDEGAAGGLHDVAGDDRELGDLQDALDLDDQAVDEAEVAAGDAADGGDRLGVGEVGEVEGEPELASVPAQDEEELVVAKWPVLVGEANSAVQLGYLDGRLSIPSMPMQQPKGPAVKAVAPDRREREGHRWRAFRPRPARRAPHLGR